VLDAWDKQRPLRFTGGPRALVDFLLSAHITGLAVAMLLYANERLLPIIFATAVAIGSKAVFRAPVGGSSRHFFNPSNFGITVTLLAFSWVSISPPYHFTENLDGLGDWLLPGLIVVTGSLLNGRLTGKFPLIAGWLGGFVLQAALRSVLFAHSLTASLLPMTGLAFVLFTFYMVTDPGTTPIAPRAQTIFGLSVALCYGVLTALHIVFDLFFALTIVCFVRGVLLYASAYAAHRPARVSVPSPAVARRPEL
jgi:enediyne biosynthesis protein E5